jgi:tetratricopeptide (TPR) repeat protein
MATRIKTANRLLIAALVVGLIGTIFIGHRLTEIEQFNAAALSGGKPAHTHYKFETRYAAAYALARQGRYQDATQLFGQLMEAKGTPGQIAAVQYNLGNIFLVRGLMVNRNGATVKDEAEYLLNQARLSYQQSLRLDNKHLDVRYNLDRVLAMLPENATARDDQEKLGIVMGNIPTGLP